MPEDDEILRLSNASITSNAINFDKSTSDFLFNYSFVEKHYDFQRKEKREPRRPYDENDVIKIMTGKDPSQKVEKKKKPKKGKKPPKPAKTKK